MIFSFGKRNLIKQGGSRMISLPMIWIKSVNPEMRTVIIEMDSENKLIIVAGDTRQDTTGSNNIHGSEYH
ncbi:hypothetical protein [Methanosarcina sp. UBA5]|uniref:hypothetical protein n=1 Tax=Methanosarcina sp. UBA5 TaxID=1915593 RepID=UPI0025D6C31C|nr:hypothetical protein [Methanosarcina sp. UBA5]